MIRTDRDGLRQSIQRQREQLDTSHALLTDSGTHTYTPHEVILELEGICLRAFTPQQPNGQSPLLLCYALVNRPWILDLAPDCSLVNALLAQGFSVYLIDWGSPSRSQQHLGLEHYIGQLLHQCVLATTTHANANQVNLIGICQGGVFSLCYAALHPERVHRLITLVTPVDFHVEAFTLSKLYRNTNTAQLVAAYGNIPGELVTQMFTALEPMRQGQFRHLHTHARLNRTRRSAQQFLLMEQWLQDCPDLAGKALQQFVQIFFKDNSLMTGQFRLGRLEVDVGRMNTPVLNIYGKQDHLVPADASCALQTLLPAEQYHSLGIRAGHIGTLMSSRALKEVPTAIRDWMESIG
ncbi:MAG: alpha/beta fold hydrolase [Marinobacterium sp.]